MNMFWKRKRLYFLHINHTGGTSLEKALRPHFANEDICPHYEIDDWQHVQNGETLKPYKLFIGHSPVDIKKLIPPKTLSVTIMRDPVERCLAAYNYFRLDAHSGKFEDYEQRKMDFDQYLDDELPNNRRLGRYAQMMPLANQETIEELKVDFDDINEADAQLLHFSTYEVQLFDLLGFSDNLEGLYKRICKAMGWKAESMPDLKPSTHSAEEHSEALRLEDLTDAQRKKVRRMYRAEQELYDFTRCRKAAVLD
jgi:hypothetical protein